MGMSKRKTDRQGGTRAPQDSKRAGGGSSAGPISFFLAVIIMVLGLIQLAATFHNYAINLSQLNALKNQQAALIAQKQDLENQIQRWDDKAYVTAQARERLGFVFPGEQAIKVLHADALASESKDQDEGKGADAPHQNALPWYQELAYSFKKADQKPAREPAQSEGKAPEEGGKGDQAPGTQQEDQAKGDHRGSKAG